MKFKNKQKTKEVVPTPKMITENDLKEHLKNLQSQLNESQTKAVMLQGAIQMVELQLKELNPQSEENKVPNGVS